MYNDSEILAWYCKCVSGALEIGCSAHIASLNWYLGLVRHNDNKVPASKTEILLNVSHIAMDETASDL